MKLLRLLKISCACVVFLSFALFIKDVHNVTQDRITSLKRDLVLAVEQRDAVRLDIDTLKAANSDLLITRKAQQEAELKNKEEIASLTKLRDEHLARIAELEQNLKSVANTQSDLDKVRKELEEEKNSKAELSKKLERAQDTLAQKELISKIALEREEEIKTMKSSLMTREHELQIAEANANKLRMKIADLEKKGFALPAIKTVNNSQEQVQFL